jgi:hypothetical protein
MRPRASLIVANCPQMASLGPNEERPSLFALRQAAIRAVCFPTVAMKDSGPDHDSATSFAEVVTRRASEQCLAAYSGSILARS